MPERIKILDVPVDAMPGMEACVARVARFVEDGARACRSVLAVNPEKMMAARADPELLEALNGAGMLIPDGIGVVLVARLAGYRQVRRVPGIELMDALCARAAALGWPVFLLGARPGINQRAAEQLKLKYPALEIAGHRDGYFGDDDAPGIIERINASGAKIVFVGLGSPRQELWMARHLNALDARVCQGVGGSFDVIAGAAKRAPAIFLRLNLEWLYRLIRQPSRLVRQTALPRFVWLVLREKLAGRRRGE